MNQTNGSQKRCPASKARFYFVKIYLKGRATDIEIKSESKSKNRKSRFPFVSLLSKGL